MTRCKHNFKLTGTHLRYIVSTPARINEFTCEHCGQRKEEYA